MKIVIGGPSGSVGSQILRQCLTNPTFTSVVALVRRPLDGVEHPKLNQVLMKDEDYITYPESVKNEVKGAKAAIWAIGYVPGSAAHIDNAQLRRVSIDYPYSAATAFGSLAAAEGNRFQFVYLSGALVEDDPKKTLWIHGTFRHTRGEGDTKLLAAVKEVPALEVTVVRPGFIRPSGTVSGLFLRSIDLVVDTEAFIASVVDYAINGCPRNIVRNAELREHGARLLQKRA